MSSRITNFTRHLNEEDLCTLLCEFVEIKLQLKFLDHVSDIECVGGSASSSIEKSASERVTRRRATRKPNSDTSLFRFRCLPELYKNTIPFVVNDDEWSVELYKSNSKLPHGCDSLQLRKAFYARKAYAFIVSSNPHATFPETFAVVRTVMEQSDVSLHVRAQPLVVKSIDDVMTEPIFVYSLYNDPHEIFVHGWRCIEDLDYKSTVELENDDSPLYRVCYFKTKPDENDTSDVRVLLVYETLKTSSQGDSEDSFIVVYPNAPDSAVQDDNARVCIGDEKATVVLACNMHFYDGALPGNAEINGASCLLDNCNFIQFESLHDLVMTHHDQRSIKISRHKVGPTCSKLSCKATRCAASVGAGTFQIIRSRRIFQDNGDAITRPM